MMPKQIRLLRRRRARWIIVLDRLRYDRPSKAFDWLIKKAKSSIDELAHLPAWHPTTSSATAAQESDLKHNDLLNSNTSGPLTKRSATVAGGEDEWQELHHRNISDNPNTQISSILPPSLDYDILLPPSIVRVQDFWYLTSSICLPPTHTCMCMCMCMCVSSLFFLQMIWGHVREKSRKPKTKTKIGHITHDARLFLRIK